MYDVIFIGSGHAAWHGAQILARAGKKVALIEENKVAGTCTNFGCNAKILLDGPAEMIHHLHHYHGIGINQTPDIIWPELMAYKHEVIDPLSDGLAHMLSVDGIDIIAGHAKFMTARSITVAGETYTAEQFVIATGQRPAKLPIVGSELTHDSTDFLDLPDMPKSMVFIGAGYIAMEFASIAHASGSHVTLIEHGDRALTGFDADYAKVVVADMTEKGIKFAFNHTVSGVSAVENGQYLVTTAQGDSYQVDYVMDTTGRVANTENLGLENIGVLSDRQGILVDHHLQTRVPNIYASGDVISKPIARLTPTATFESHYIASMLLGDKKPIAYPAIPTVAFTLPRIAQIGVTTDEAKKRSDLTVIEIPYGQIMRFQTLNDVHAAIKIVMNQDKHLVGAALIGDFAPEVINALVPVINKQYTSEDIKSQIFAFPTHTGIVLPMIANYLA
ncbi:glutathione reductase [Leuconostoc sp. C2]|uniref:Glutathione reductase n=3 Tax=Lactobacillaceae TaxID=33958 RepID=D5T275_LEUKI|nr:NAD(P)/FAD-dependent oxidoreductase [Leuconostoc rapi]ADG40374.1 glutathione reductase [Leuconostoc kimchii IMSNU 11154]AEJ31701.1 glutathione reductase [Leuconostoc sp. C2]MBM7436500.1 glutathione reductase (NADPH) [Leuconostoc rapi]QBR46857.1 NAD(P)/FAD-dependent oxidoreductase [Leuconostoc kimchii]